jgi:hypothetical protein
VEPVNFATASVETVAGKLTMAIAVNFALVVCARSGEKLTD